MRKLKDLERKEFIRGGKVNDIYATNYPEYLCLDSTNRTTCGNGERMEEFDGKGVANNKISCILFELLEKNGISTHFISKGDNETSKFVKKLDMIPLEVINRRYTAGSFCKRYACDANIPIVPSGVEFCLKNDDLGDPFMPNFAMKALGIATYKEIQFMKETCLKVSDVLSDFFDINGIKLIDFKIEFGKDEDGNILVADEISPDTCRLVDKKTGESLDKDVFREKTGDISSTYAKLLEKIGV